MYRTDPNFSMHTIPYVNRLVNEAFIIEPNTTEVHIETQMWLNRPWKAGALATPEVPPLTTTSI